MNRILKLILVAGSVVLLSGFLFKDYFHHANTKTGVPAFHIDSAEIKAANIFNKHAVDTSVSMLQSGNIVLRMGLGADSKLLSGLNSKDQSFSHCGIVFIENGYPFVYHSIGGEDNPDERLRRDSARFYFSPINNLGLGIVRYDFDTEKIARLRKVGT